MAAFGDDEMDDVFKALADPSRRMLLDSLNAHNGQTLRQLCAGLDMARQSVSKHLAVLEAAGLVTTVRRGREKLHYLNAAPISDIAERVQRGESLDAAFEPWGRRLGALFVKWAALIGETIDRRGAIRSGEP